MGIETALIVGALAATAVGTTTSIIAGNQQRAAARHANDLQQQAAGEQRAQNAQNEAEAARQQYRQDRIARARIMQSASNTGASFSSGELGSTGSLQTQYANNSGQLQGGYERNVTIGNLMSEANDSIFQGNQRAGNTANIGSIFSGLGSLAGTVYGATAKASKIPGTTPQATTGQ